jgi:alginate O-acetyltransferase complex protein AlgJ
MIHTGSTAMSRRSALVICVIFVLILYMPLAGRAYLLMGQNGAIEDVLYDAFPSYDFGNPSALAVIRKYPSYFNKYHVFREELISWYARGHLELFGVSSNSRVVVGTEGWLFLNELDEAMSYFRGTKPFREEDLAAWRHALEAKRDWLERRGIRYLFVVGPNKHSIYGEFIPEHYNRAREVTRLDQLSAELRANSKVRLVDPRLALNREKAALDLYYRRDSHWNDHGAFIAYGEIAAALQDMFPDIVPISASELESELRIDPADLFFLLGIKGGPQMKSEHLLLREETQSGDAMLPVRGDPSPNSVTPIIPNAVMFHDSFGPALQTFLSPHFARILYVDQRPHQRGTLDTLIINEERPDIVIEEMVERDLMRSAPLDPFLNHK